LACRRKRGDQEQDASRTWTNNNIAEFQRTLRVLDSAMTGEEKSLHVSRNITGGTSGFSCGCWSGNCVQEKEPGELVSEVLYVLANEQW